MNKKQNYIAPSYSVIEFKTADFFKDAGVSGNGNVGNFEDGGVLEAPRYPMWSEQPVQPDNENS